ncbi:MAG TPA: PKD domain-containing protein [Chitinophagaceae bacterium]|nr:PKD domain-containing protein [Chitinophagaceae bacterium]
MQKFAAIFILLCITWNAQAVTKRVLFIGNSYVSVNDLPNTFKSLSVSLGDSVYVDSYAPGGYTFLQHSQDANVIAKLQNGGWDIVVLQAQSQEPSFPPAQVATDTYPYAAKLDSLIHHYNPCAETMFYMTWGKKNGDAGNCAGYPILCTYGGVAMRLRESYLEMTQDNEASCSPVGVSWDRIITTQPTIELFASDGSHPNANGTYLTACTFYSSIFHKSSVGASYVLSGVTASNATLFQTTATQTVMDSLENWQQYGSLPRARFTVSNVQNQYSFTNQSLRSNQYSWDFGDGSALSTQISPTHTYSSIGVFTVNLKASNTCGIKDSVSTVVQISNVPNGLAGNTEKSGLQIQFSRGIMYYTHAQRGQQMSIVNQVGQTVARIEFTTSEGQYSLPSLPTGCYVYQVLENGKALISGKWMNLE